MKTRGQACDFPRPDEGHSNPIAVAPRPGVPARSWRAEAPGAKAAPFNNVLSLAPRLSLCHTVFQSEKMKLKFPKQTKYRLAMLEWVSAHRPQIDAGHEICMDLGERIGFVRKSATITICADPGTFETDWKWAPSTFPSPLKALAQTLRIEGLFGAFAAKYCDGHVTIRKVETGLT